MKCMSSYWNTEVTRQNAKLLQVPAVSLLVGRWWAPNVSFPSSMTEQPTVAVRMKAGRSGAAPGLMTGTGTPRATGEFARISVPLLNRDTSYNTDRGQTIQTHQR